MKQTTLASSNGFELYGKKTRKRVFLQEMNEVVPWDALLKLIEPHYANSGKHAGAKGGRPATGALIMLKIHFMQQWFGLSDEAMEEALHDVPMYREFAGLDIGGQRMPDESTILRFRHLLQEHELAPLLLVSINTILADRGLLLKSGTVVDATLIAAPSSTKNEDGKRDPEMRQTKKGNNYHFGMKAHIGVDAQSGLVHSVTTTPANAHDITQAHKLLHGQEDVVFADSGYRGIDKRAEIKERQAKANWHVAMMPSHRKALRKSKGRWAKMLEKAEKLKASVRAKVEHAFQVIKCQWGYRKVRYKGLAKNTQQILTLFALVNLYKVRQFLKPMMPTVGQVRLKTA